MTGHDLAPLELVEGGYLGRCSCGWHRAHPHRAGVEAQHEYHLHLEDLRVALNDGKGERAEDS